MSVDWQNVRDHGAAGDGVTDDTAAFAAAIAAGQPVWVPAGTYILSNLVLSTEKVIITGEGQGLAILKHKNAASDSMIKSFEVGSPSLPLFVLRDLTINGNMANITNRGIDAVEVRVEYGLIERVETLSTIRTAFRFNSVKYMAIVQDCFLHDFALATGVSGENTAAMVIHQDLAEVYEGAVWVQRNRIEMTTAPENEGNSVAGIQISASDDAYTRPVFVLDNILRNMGQDIAGNIIAPIQIYRNGPGSVIRGNRIYRSYWGGIKVQRSSDIIIEGNLIQDVGEHGPTGASAILVQSRVPELASARIQIVNNIVNSMDPIPGITVTAGSESFSDVIVAGNIIDGALRGISFSRPNKRIDVSNNIIRNIGGTSSDDDGVVFENMESAVDLSLNISFNHIDTVARRGISLFQDSVIDGEATINGNILNDVGSAGVQAILVRRLKRLIASGNIIKGSASASHGFDLRNIGEVVLTDNTSDVRARTYTSLTLIKERGNNWAPNGFTLSPATGVTTVIRNDGRKSEFTITVATGAWTAAATTQDITLVTIPAKTRILSVISDVTQAFAGTGWGSARLRMGTSAGGQQLILDHDVAGAVTKGLLDGDLGASINRAAAVQGGFLNSWVATTVVQTRLTTTGANVSTITAGAVTFYVTVETQ